MNGLAKFFQGLAQACEGLAEACGGAAGARALPDATAARAALQGVLERLAGAGAAPEAPEPEVEAPVLGDAHIVGPPGTQGRPAAPEADPAAVPAPGDLAGTTVIEACQELERQTREKGRRAKLLADPVSAMHVVEYYVMNLCSHPLQAEDWTRSIEAIPGNADTRVDAARRQGLGELGGYARSWDDIQAALAKAGKIADALRQDPAYDATDLLDEDRAGRILFWLGDRPKEIDINAPEFQPRADDPAPVQPTLFEFPGVDAPTPGVFLADTPTAHFVERAAAPGVPALTPTP